MLAVKPKDTIDYEDDHDYEGEHCSEKEQAKIFSNGKWHTFSTRSLYIFSLDNSLRKFVIRIITHRFFDRVIVSLIMINSLLLGIKDYTDKDNLTSINQFVEKSEALFVWSFTAECILKIVGMGFIIDDGSYLRDAWNWLDFIVVVSSLLTEIPQMKSVSGMRTFRLMRPLRSLTTMPSMKILISTLLASVSQLGGVLVLAIFFFTIFAILGVSLWSGKIYNRCRLTEFPVDGIWEADPEILDLCSEVSPCPENRWCGSLAEASRDSDSKYTLLEGTQKWSDSMIEELNFGYSSFNHLPSAFLTIFQCITLEGWINVCNMYEDAYDVWFVDIYFVLCIIVCSFFVLNLTIAVMLLKYEDFDKSEKGSTHMEELHEYGKEIGLPDRFVEFIIEQDSINISQKGLRILKNQKQESIWKQLIKSTVTYDKDDKYYHNSLTRFMFLVVNSPIFNGLITFIIMLNTITLSMEKYPEYEKETTTAKFLSVGNVVFTLIFTFEVIMKLIGLGVWGYSADKFNLFDAFIVIVSIMEMILASGSEDSGNGGAFSALRAFRLFRIFKIFRAGDLRTLLDSIAFTIITIKDYSILLSLFIYVFALLGMSFFAGKVKFDGDWNVDPEKGESPRWNFDILGWAALTVFEVMIGENWNSIMYDHMRGAGEASCIYFIGLVIFGNIVMLNLFLAILLGNFDRARAFGEKKKIIDAFESLSRMGYKLNIAIAYLFDDQDFTKYIEDKILADKGEKEPQKHMKMQGDDEEHCLTDHTEQEIRQVFYSMSTGKIEDILTGDMQLQEIYIEGDENLQMSEQQREKIIEILNYIKRQNILRKQRLDFHDQLRKNQTQREALDQIHAGDDDLSSESEDSALGKSFFEVVLNHIENSSLLIFHQKSSIRYYCQLCIQTDDDAEAVTKDQKSQEGQDNAPSGNNKIVAIDNNQSEFSSPNRSRLTKSVAMKEKNRGQLLSLTSANGMINQKKSSLNRKITVVAGKQNKKGKKNMVAKIFEGIIMTLIIVSSVTLVIDNPMSDPDSEALVFIGYMDMCFTVLFTLEAAIKIIAMGFIFNNQVIREQGMQPYLRNPWNMLDFVVVVASLIDFIVTIKMVPINETTLLVEDQEQGAIASNLQSFKALRALRALRPLRMISRNKGMKLIVNALLSSLPSMTNVTIVCCLFLLIFAIMGVDWFKGQFDFCEMEDPDMLAQVITSEDCIRLGGEWVNPKETFDNSLLGFRTLFEMMSTEGWIDIMNAGIDSVNPVDGLQMQPKQNNSLSSIVYFVVFMIFGSQFILNLFVGVIMDNFNKIKEKEELGSLFVTEDQRCWIDAQRLGLSKTLQKKIDPPPGWRGRMFNFVTNPMFDGIITFFIGFNTLVMAIKFDGMDKSLEGFFEYLNYMFAFIFNMEMIFKLMGLGSQYFYSAWNLFDCVVVIGTDIGILLNIFSTGSSFSTAATVVRAFRIMRIVRLVRSQENIKIILGALVHIIPQITNFIALMFLLLFIYAALGINVFSGVVHQEFITPKNNFQSIGGAILYLFRCSTGEDWNKIMHELALTSETSSCIDDQDYGVMKSNNLVVMGCGSTFSYIYFLSFTIIIAWLIMNLSVAAVIEGLENAKDENTGIISGDDVQALIDAWQEYDPKATGWIDVHDFVCLIIELPPPFGNIELRKMCQYSQSQFKKAQNLIYNKESVYANQEKLILIKNKDILKILAAYKIQTYMGRDKKVHFKDIFQILVKKIFTEEFQDFEISKYLKKKMKNQWLEKHKRVKELPKTGFKAHHSFASQIITSYAKRFKSRKEREELCNFSPGQVGFTQDQMDQDPVIKENNQINNSQQDAQQQSYGHASVEENPQLGELASDKDANEEQPINFNQALPEEESKNERNQESLIGSAHDNAIRRDQSISDSNMDKFDSQANLIDSNKNDEEAIEMPNKAYRKENKSAHLSDVEKQFESDLRDSMGSHKLRVKRDGIDLKGNSPPKTADPCKQRAKPPGDDHEEKKNLFE